MKTHKKLIRTAGLAVVVIILMVLLSLGLEGHAQELTKVVLEATICGGVEGFIEI